MATPKVTGDMIRPFTGDGDVVAWLTKVKLVAKLTKVEDLAAFIPLYLEGGALAVYLEMGAAEKMKYACVETKLKEAFSDNMFVAYAKMKSRKWAGESVDVYVNELRRLACLAGYKGEECDHTVKLAFVTGFPDDIGVELQQINNISNVDMSEVLSRARILVMNRLSAGVAAVSIKNKDDGRQQEGGRSGQSYRKNEQHKSNYDMKCFHCGGGHMIRHCPEKLDRKIVCYRCGEQGHISTKCPQKENQGNE